MLRYCTTAAALKAFSLPPARPLYRTLGNRVGGARRARGRIEAGPSHYLARAERILEAARKHRLIDDGATILEIGTGWVHWEATVLRLFYDLQATLVDVWDNRQLAAFKAYVGQLEPYIDSHFAVSRADADRAHQLLRKLLHAKTFDELYAITGFEYVIDPSGALAALYI
jgi:hypothetical protein